MEGTINLNNAQCIKEVVGFGTITYKNLCNGAQVILPWGLDNWGLLALVIIIIGFLGFTVYSCFQ